MNDDKNETSLVFTGDIGFDKYMDGKWEDEELISEEVLHFLHSGNHVIANVEGPLVPEDTEMAEGNVKQLMHTMNPKAVKVFKNMKADIWNLCNNHIMDASDFGVQCTLEEAKKAGCKTVGAGMNLKEAMLPLFLEEAGGIGMFSVGYRRGCKPAGDEKAGCLTWNEMDKIRDIISDIKSKCRWCVVIAHGGEEFTSLPNPYTRDRYIEYLNMGADIVVSHHPHVPMNYELIGNKAIFYSLGNFIFDTDYQRAQFNTEKGILLKLNLTEDSYTFDALGIKIERGSEHIVKSELPKIFTNVPEKEYELLSPLAAKMFIAATKRQQIYLNAAEYKDASEEKWKEHFANPKRSGRVEGEGLDFFLICPLAERESQKEWQKSSLEEVKQYILEQM